MGTGPWPAAGSRASCPESSSGRGTIGPVLPEEFARVKAIVAAALDRPATQRATYIDEACGANTALRAEVESLLGSPVLATGGLGPALPAELVAEVAERSAIGLNL